MRDQQFSFEFERRYAVAAAPFGVWPARCSVMVTATSVVARFGWWRVETELTNVASATATGPYAFIRTAGPARLTLGDRGLTFATNSHQGVQLDFVAPVAGIDPAGVLRHPNLTVTVADIAGLLSALAR